MKPHCNNFCGGNFQDWLEVLLTSQCNGTCSWCIEKHGWHPEKVASWVEITEAAIKSEKKNIILLGGEPTLYEDLKHVIATLKHPERKVFLTTNGSMLTREFVLENNLFMLDGINISIHHDDLDTNAGITGVRLNFEHLLGSIVEMQKYGVKVRLNCNILEGHINSAREIKIYVDFARQLGVDGIRFAELKTEGSGFVSLAKILDGQFGLNEEPFSLGCNREGEIDGMKVNFRQMCGIQTSERPKPISPEQNYKKSVLYYDANIYDGWQRKEWHMPKAKNDTLKTILEKVARSEMTVESAQRKIREMNRQAFDLFLADSDDQDAGTGAAENDDEDYGGNCRY